VNPRRILFALAATMALAVSAGVFVVALAYGLFALVKPFVGSAGGAGIVAAAAALFIAIIAMILSAMGRPPPRKKPSEPQSFVERASEFIKERPVLAIATALAAGLLAVRNPRYLGAALRAFVEGREPPGR
jgi:hypothetical protein